MSVRVIDNDWIELPDGERLAIRAVASGRR